MHSRLQPDFVTAIEMVTMSQKEFQRVKTIENAGGGQRSVSEGAHRVELSEGQRATAEQPYSARFPFGSATISESTRS